MAWIFGKFVGKYSSPMEHLVLDDLGIESLRQVLLFIEVVSYMPWNWLKLNMDTQNFQTAKPLNFQTAKFPKPLNFQKGVTVPCTDGDMWWFQTFGHLKGVEINGLRSLERFQGELLAEFVLSQHLVITNVRSQEVCVTFTAGWFDFGGNQIRQIQRYN